MLRLFKSLKTAQLWRRVDFIILPQGKTALWFALVSVLYSHTLACTFHTVATLGREETSWMTETGLDQKS